MWNFQSGKDGKGSQASPDNCLLLCVRVMSLHCFLLCILLIVRPPRIIVCYWLCYAVVCVDIVYVFYCQASPENSSVHMSKTGVLGGFQTPIRKA